MKHKIWLATFLLFGTVTTGAFAETVNDDFDQQTKDMMQQFNNRSNAMQMDNQSQYQARVDNMNGWFQAKKAEQESRLAPQREAFEKEYEQTRNEIQHDQELMKPFKDLLNSASGMMLRWFQAAIQFMSTINPTDWFSPHNNTPSTTVDSNNTSDSTATNLQQN